MDEQPRPPATRAEARALAHPTRLRIIRLTTDDELTLTELSDALQLDKASVLYHVRTLLREGFLAGAPPRRSPAGRPVKPYRSTGKSRAITLHDRPEVPLAVLDAFRQEVAAHHDPCPMLIRCPLRLSAHDREELAQRLARLVAEFEDRRDPAGELVNFLVVAVTEGRQG